MDMNDRDKEKLESWRRVLICAVEAHEGTLCRTCELNPHACALRKEIERLKRKLGLQQDDE